MVALHKRARTTPAVRAEIAASIEPATVHAPRYGVSEQTLRKWKHRRGFTDRSHTVTVTAANEADISPLPHLVRADDEVIFADAGYTRDSYKRGARALGIAWCVNDKRKTGRGNLSGARGDWRALARRPQALRCLRFDVDLACGKVERAPNVFHHDGAVRRDPRRLYDDGAIDIDHALVRGAHAPDHALLGSPSSLPLFGSPQASPSARPQAAAS